jgi:uncharacterized protein
MTARASGRGWPACAVEFFIKGNFQMGRLLLLIAIAAVVYLVIKSYLRKGLRQENPAAEDMVRCAHCGVHLPKSESILANGHCFCGIAHRDAAGKK